MRDFTTLIGQTTLIEGKRLRVIEVLVDEEMVILENASDETELQENQFGNIQRRSRKNYPIPFYSSLGDDTLHPVIQLLFDSE
ncbi:MAG TPA: hypothetical protein DD827_06985 [Gammaproteobacteria bacterium]|nr:hypothetical protein [Gammaproteobacteria bacterium]